MFRCSACNIFPVGAASTIQPAESHPPPSGVTPDPNGHCGNDILICPPCAGIRKRLISTSTAYGITCDGDGGTVYAPTHDGTEKYQYLNRPSVDRIIV